MKFTPQPIDTTDISLPADLLTLTEQIAENTHNVWAKGRLQEGWRYGTERNDAKKITPCLVPYEDLPESEKEFDRNTSLQTIKLILKLGYKIEKAD